MYLLAQDSGGSLIPDWAADLPPWAKVVIAIVFGGPTLLAAVAALIGSVRALTRRSQTTPEPTDPDNAPTPTPTTPELRRPAADMAAVDRALRILEESQDEDRAKIAALEKQVAELVTLVRARDQTIADLRTTLDQVLGRGRTP